MGSALIWVEALRPINAKSPSGERVFEPGEVFQANPEKAVPLIEQGIVKRMGGALEDEGDSSDVLEGFGSLKLAVRIRSKILGEDVYLVSDENVRDNLQSEGLPVYLPEEIECLKGLSEEDLKMINTIKKIFEKSKVIKGRC